jgi:Tol biopolymer transport system component
VRRCLEKNPAARFHSASDLAFALEALSGSDVTSGAGQAAVTPTAEQPKSRERLALIAVSGLLVLSTFAVAVLYLRRPAAEHPVTTRFLIHPPEKTELRGSFAVSPDGRRVVLRGLSEGKVFLWMRPLDSLTAQPLPGTEEALYPFWSPDSRFVGFFAGGKLKKIEAAGGPVQTLCDAADGRGATWNADGVIVFSPGDGQPLFKVSAAGGAPAPLTALEQSRGELSHFHPHFLPDGRHFLYLVISSRQEHTGIRAGSLDSRESKPLVNTDVNAAYAPPGYLLFLRDRTLMAQSFDADRLEITGEPSPATEVWVAEGVDRLGGGSRYALFSVSGTGVLVYRSGTSESSQLSWFDRAGQQLGTVGPVGANYSVPWLSPDERRVAFSASAPQGGSGDIWFIELARGTLTRFTFDPAPDLSPLWSPDGGRILFTSERDGTPNLYQKAASGAGAEEVLVKSDYRKIPNDWSADGNFILYQELNPKTVFDLWVFPLAGEQRAFPFLQTQFDERQGRFSPDGKWIAYASNESGTWQVYVQSFPASGGKWQVSTAGGSQPQWRKDGREIFYLSADRKLMAVEVKANGSTFEVGEPRMLFELRIQSVGLPGPRNFFAAAGDGQRFLVNSLSGDQTARPTTVVLNWTADLKR